MDESGDPMLTIGPGDSGTAVIVTKETIDLWRYGNAVVTVTAGGGGGRINVVDGEDGPLRSL